MIIISYISDVRQKIHRFLGRYFFKKTDFLLRKCDKMKKKGGNTMTEIKKVVVAGAGTMGNTLAQIFAENGYQTVLYNWRMPSLEWAKIVIEKKQNQRVAEGEMTGEEAKELLSRISYTCEWDCFTDADFVIESIVEDLEKKWTFYEKATSLLPKDAILVTNTSGLSIDVLSQKVKFPQRFAGMNWWNPADLVPLVEVVKGENTSDTVCQDILQIAKRIGKEPVLVKRDAKGFVGNRLQLAVLREALHIVESGIASPEDVDKVMKYGLGMRYTCVGPFETIDLGGIDVFSSIAKGLFRELSNEKEGSALLEKMVRENKLGLKIGKGFFDYEGETGDEVVAKRDKGLKDISRYIKR